MLEKGPTEGNKKCTQSKVAELQDHTHTVHVKRKSSLEIKNKRDTDHLYVGAIRQCNLGLVFLVAISARGECGMNGGQPASRRLSQFMAIYHKNS